MVGSSRGGVLAVSVASAREEKLQRRRELSRSSRLCVASGLRSACRSKASRACAAATDQATGIDQKIMPHRLHRLGF